MKRYIIIILAFNLLFLSACNKKESIIEFEKDDLESIEVYHFIVPADAEAMLVTETDDIDRIVDSFKSTKIKGKIKDPYVVGGEVLSFRFNLKNGGDRALIYYEGMITKPDSTIYEVYDSPIVTLWDDLDYEKIKVDEDRLPVINR